MPSVDLELYQNQFTYVTLAFLIYCGFCEETSTLNNGKRIFGRTWCHEVKAAYQGLNEFVLCDYLLIGQKQIPVSKRKVLK